MFWKRREAPKAQPKPSAAAPSAKDAALLEAALDAVADFLRAYGSHGFEIEHWNPEDLEAHCQAWAQHLLVGTPEPNRTRVATAEAPPPGPPRRNWAGARRFVSEHREAEVSDVQEGIASMRDALWAFIQALSHSLRDDRSGDGQLLRQMHRLKSAVDQNRPDEIRSHALEAVDLVRDVVEARKGRQSRQMEALGARVEEMRSRLNQARKAASIDPLTTLFNRAAFDEHVQHVADLGQAFGRSACLVLVDIDHFKWLNDRYGHQAGDAALRALGECLNQVFLRKADFVARYGGEEFAVVLDAEEIEGATVAAERMLESIRAIEVEHGDEQLRITASAGLSRLVPGEDITGWIERADQALYRAKDGGRDRLALENESA